MSAERERAKSTGMPTPENSTADRRIGRRAEPPASHQVLARHAPTVKRVVETIQSFDRDPRTPPGPFTHRLLRRILREHPRDANGFFTIAQIIGAFDRYGSEWELQIDRDALLSRLNFRPTRTQSGVAPVAVFTKPFPCPGRCIYCPNDVRMPKSYLRDEPGAQRAEDNGFDPYAQTWMRLKALHATGQPISKIELIVLGGTWTAYPEHYRHWFVQRCFDALNEFSPTAEPPRFPITIDRLNSPSPQIDGANNPLTYNTIVSQALRINRVEASQSPSSRASISTLIEAHRKNEHARHRCVGLVVETRPDEISKESLLELRALGVTKIQLGVQSLRDDVLHAIKRGHDMNATYNAFALCRRYGFKILAHWMPNLVGATPDSDRDDFIRMFSDPRLRPDELKIYPCMLIENTELMRLSRSGAWSAYDDDTLRQVLAHVLEHTPRYCRLSRVIRDIPSTDIVEGSHRANFRELAHNTLSDKGAVIRDIRAREIRKETFKIAEFRPNIIRYDSGVGAEFFIEWIDASDRIAGFCRLLLPSTPSPLDELRNAALLRELHVYGRAQSIGSPHNDAVQHRGLGTRLIEYATSIARDARFEKLSVISAVGTRAYYRSRNFYDGNLYQHYPLKDPQTAT
ncbi:MAG: tRNA uridine(34) 5-carboxymethylaminomethyl modification radical SAM/GNAT enzyme Elp3 [Polyangiales bacterium]